MPYLSLWGEKPGGGGVLDGLHFFGEGKTLFFVRIYKTLQGKTWFFLVSDQEKRGVLKTFGLQGKPFQFQIHRLIKPFQEVQRDV